MNRRYSIKYNVLKALQKISILLLTLQAFCLQAAEEDPVLKAHAAMRKGDCQEAIVLFESCLELQANDANLLLLLTECNYMLGNYNKALGYCSQIGAEAGSEPELWMAKLYVATDDFEKALDHLAAALSSHPSPAEVFRDSSFTVLHATKRWQDLIASDWLTSHDLVLKEAQYFLSRNNVSKALEVLEKQLSLQPVADILAFRAQVYQKQGDLQLAIRDINAAFQLEPDFEIALSRARLLEKSGDHQNAIQAYGELIHEFPHKFHLYKERTAVLIKSDELQAAQADLNLLESYLGADPELAFMAAQVHFASGAYKNALLRLNPLFNEPIIKAEWYHLRGEVYYESGVIRNAASDFNMVLDLQPRNAEAYFMLGQSLLKMGQNPKACYNFKKALRHGDHRALEFIQKYCD